MCFSEVDSMKKGYWSAIGLALVMALTLWHRVAAAGSAEDNRQPDVGRQVGLTSTAVECLVVNAGTLDSASATVRLEWEGQVEEAFLVLAAAGSQGGHSIYVNGRRVGSAPVRPGGQPCQAGSSAFPLMSTDSIPIPAEVLVNGENEIRLTNDANVNDGWTAANLHLEIHGLLSLPPATLESRPPALLPSEIGVTAVVSGYVRLESSYDGVEHEVWYQIPNGYTGNTPVPLLLGIHGWGGSGESEIDFMGAAVNARGWLFAAPNMHGRFYIDGKRALAWPGAQHDVIDAIEYMASYYNVDTSRIYIAGGSMGGQITTVMAAKYPDVFAAAAGYSGFTDLTDWYNELAALGQGGLLRRIRREIDPNCDPDFDPVCGTPEEEPFEYQRRSAIEMPQNSRLVPLHMWHNEADELVPVHHAHDLAGAINSWNPPMAVTVTTVITAGCTDTYKHCYGPEFDEVLDYLASFTLSSQPPPSVTIRTDESKPYYWLNVAQTGNDHWSQVEATCSPADETVTTTISDTQPLTCAFNLGSTPIMGAGGISRPGMGLPATTYLVNGGGNHKLEDYTSGYLTATLTTTGQFTLTISAITVETLADPSMVLASQTATSTIKATAQDHLDNPVPDGTTIEFSTTEGTFLNGSSTYTDTLTGGQVTTTLSLEPTADLAEITASVESVTGSTQVNVIHPAIGVLVTPDQMTVYSGQAVTYTYQITNAGDITLTTVTVVDDNGTPGDGGDDLIVCAGITLAAEATASCSRGVTLTQTTINTAAVTGKDPLDNDVTGSDSTAVNVISPAIEVAVTPNQTTVYSGQVVTYTYQITNTGDITLTAVTVVDDNGTPGDGGDDLIVCAGITLAAEATTSCSCSATRTQTTISIVTVTGKDPLDNDVTGSDSTAVNVISPAIEVAVTPSQTTIHSGEVVTYTYQITNTGDITLTNVTVVDDNGTPGKSDDDVTVCADMTLTAGATQNCSRSMTLIQDTTSTATVTAQYPLGNDVTDSDSVTVEVVYAIYLPVVIRSN